MNADAPGYTEAVAAMKAKGHGHFEAHEAAHIVLTAATGPVLAAAFADMADTLADDTEWLDAPIVAMFLDAASNQIRERTVQ